MVLGEIDRSVAGIVWRSRRTREEEGEIDVSGNA